MLSVYLWEDARCQGLMRLELVSGTSCWPSRRVFLPFLLYCVSPCRLGTTADNEYGRAAITCKATLSEQDTLTDRTFKVTPKLPANVPQPHCFGPSATLITLMIQDVVELLAFIVVTCIVRRLRKFLHPSDVKRRFASIVAGLTSALTVLAGNLVAAYLIGRSHGYQDVPKGELMLLLNSQPGVFMLLCTLGGVYILSKVNRQADTPAEARDSREQDKFGQYLASVTCSNAITAAIMQTMSAVYIFRAARAGDRKGFYHAGNSTPFWRGVPAQYMYAGALLWTIMYFFTMITLVAFANLMLVSIRASAGRPTHERKSYRYFLTPIFSVINFLAHENAKRDPPPPVTREALEDPESEPTVETDLEKADASSVAETHSQHSDPMAHTPLTQTPSNPPLRGETGLRGRFHRYRGRLIAWSLRPMTRHESSYLWTYIRLVEGLQGELPNDAPAPLRIEHERRRRWLENHFDYLHELANDRTDAETDTEVDAEVADLIRRQRRVTPVTQQAILAGSIILLILWTLTYIGQWLFWAGFVKSMGQK